MYVEDRKDRENIYFRYCPVIKDMLGITGQLIITELDPNNVQIAFTEMKDRNVNISINPYHPLIKGTPSEQRVACFTGILIHEILHNKYTNPQWNTELMERKRVKYKKLFCNISNIIEDYVIETRAIYSLSETRALSLKKNGIDLSGMLPLAALDTSIISIWTQSVSVRNQNNQVVDEVMNALIDFTDFGVSTSNMSEKGRELFYQVAPLVFNSVYQTPWQRSETTLKVYDVLKSQLTIQTNAHQQEKKEFGGTNSRADDSKNAFPHRQEKVEIEKSPVMKSAEEMLRKNQKAVSSGKQSYSGEKTKSTSKSGKASDGSNTSDNNCRRSSTGNDSGNSSSMKSHEMGEDESNNDEGCQRPDCYCPEDGALPGNLRGTDQCARSVRRFEFSEQKLPEARTQKDGKIKNTAMDAYADMDIDFLPGKYMHEIPCINLKAVGVTKEGATEYHEIVSRNASFIRSFSKELEKTVKQKEKSAAARSGHFDLNRYTRRGETTARIFLRKEEADRVDARVMICLDVSGSMVGEKIEAAKETLICINEGLRKVGIASCVMTFCELQNEVEQKWYINWSKHTQDQYALAMIHAQGSNFDGYSIRCALRQLIKEKANHPLMIVISDGKPNTRFCSDAFSDTKTAIAEAKRKAKVIGIGIDAHLKTLREFYKETFIEHTDMQTLLLELGRIIKNEVGKWK